MADPLRNPLEPDHELPPAEPIAVPGTPPLEQEINDAVERQRMTGQQERRAVNAAESLGTKVGSAIGSIRNKVQSGLELVKERSAQKSTSIEDLSDTVRERADEVTRETRLVARQWTSAAQRRYRTLRTQVEEFSEERPVEFVLAIGAVAMVAGVILRLWRSSRD